MKKYWKEFFLRGMIAMGFGPIVLSAIYWILGATGVVVSFPWAEVIKGYLSISVMAFIAGGITSIYQVEHLPLPTAILTHGAVLYLDYLIMYLFNDWIPKNLEAMSIFTAAFVGGFALIWLVIYAINKNSTRQLNRALTKK